MTAKDGTTGNTGTTDNTKPTATDVADQILTAMPYVQGSMKRLLIRKHKAPLGVDALSAAEQASGGIMPMHPHQRQQSGMVLHLLKRKPMLQGQLIEMMRLSPPAASRLLDGLERNGLVARSVSPDDRRQYVISITDRGRERLEVDTGHIRARMIAEIEELTADERKTVSDAIKIFRRQLQKKLHSAGLEQDWED
ncbi:MAG: MarR family transcriptional regulator [Actinomycetes bacterium]|jgi:DNA-binding MarR family transcriptional regulator|nr:MarR family transcriptional regulator [Actinomycetes bacterium]